MQKLIVFTEEEWHQKLVEFVDNFMAQSQKDYGVQLYSNETNDIVTEKQSICGNLFLTWENTFSTKKK